MDFSSSDNWISASSLSSTCNGFRATNTQVLYLDLKKPEKNSGLQRGLNPWPRDLPVRCSTNWAMKPLTLGAGQLWVHMFPWKKWVLMIYEINHIWTAEMKWKWRNERRCHGFKSRWSPEFFSGFFTQLHKLRSLRRSFLHFHFISAVHIWFISYIIDT